MSSDMGDLMAFREVNVNEVREVLRGWLAGAGLRTVAAQACVDRKTIRYAACGITHLIPTRWLCRATWRGAWSVRVARWLSSA